MYLSLNSHAILQQLLNLCHRTLATELLDNAMPHGPSANRHVTSISLDSSWTCLATSRHAPRCLLLHANLHVHFVFFESSRWGLIAIFIRGLHVAIISAFTSTLHGSEGDFLSCFIDSNLVCQHLAREIKHNDLSSLRDSWSAISAVQSLSSLTDQVLSSIVSITPSTRHFSIPHLSGQSSVFLQNTHIHRTRFITRSQLCHTSFR